MHYKVRTMVDGRAYVFAADVENDLFGKSHGCGLEIQAKVIRGLHRYVLPGTNKERNLIDLEDAEMMRAIAESRKAAKPKPEPVRLDIVFDPFCRKAGWDGW